MCFSDGYKQWQHERYLLFSQSVPLKCYHLWTHCKFLFVCDVVFLILVPLIVILSPAKTSFIRERHLWKTLKTRTAFFLTASYLLYIVSSVSQSWLIFFAYISPFQLAWFSFAVLLNVSIQWLLVCLFLVDLFFRHPCFFQIFWTWFL